MNLQEIAERASKRLNDFLPPGVNVSKKGWKPDELYGFADDAECEIARRLKLLADYDTIGYIKLSGTAGQIDSVSVSGVTITSAAVVYATSAARTAVLLATNISSYTSTPNYRAQARGEYVVIKANSGTGWPSAGYSLTAVATGGMTADATDLPGLCRHVIPIGGRDINLHPRLYRIIRLRRASPSVLVPSTQILSVGLYERSEIDYASPGWEDTVNGTIPNGTIRGVIPDYEGGEAIVFPPPVAAEMIEQGCQRLPLIPLGSADKMAVPEIGEKYHLAMVDWIVRQACLKPDIETWYKELAKQAESDFNDRCEKWQREIIQRDTSGQVNRVPGAFL